MNYYYVKKAYEPVMALVGMEYLAYAPGEEINLPVTIINESGENLIDTEYQLQVLDDKIQVVYEKVQLVSVSVEEYRKTYDTEPFIIPEEYCEKYFFVRVVLKKIMLFFPKVYIGLNVYCV